MRTWWLTSNFRLLLLFNDFLIVLSLVDPLLKVFRNFAEILVLFIALGLGGSSCWRSRRHCGWFCRLFGLDLGFLNSLTIGLVDHFLSLFVVFLFILFNYVQLTLTLSQVQCRLNLIKILFYFSMLLILRIKVGQSIFI